MPETDDNENLNNDEQPAPGKTFTEADVQKIIDKTIARERSKNEAKYKAELEKANMDEVERIKAELAERDAEISKLKQSVVERDLKVEAQNTALKLGVKPDKIEKLLRIAKLDGDDLIIEGKIDSDVLTETLSKELDELPEFKASTAEQQQPPVLPKSSGGDLTQTPSTDKNWTRSEIGAMPDEEYAKHREEILAANANKKIAA